MKPRGCTPSPSISPMTILHLGQQRSSVCCRSREGRKEGCAAHREGRMCSPVTSASLPAAVDLHWTPHSSLATVLDKYEKVQPCTPTTLPHTFLLHMDSPTVASGDRELPGALARVGRFRHPHVGHGRTRQSGPDKQQPYRHDGVI